MESSFVDLHLSLGKKFVVVLPKNCPLRGDGFEPVAMQMVYEFTRELVETVKVGVEPIVAIGCPDETPVSKPPEDSVYRVPVVIAELGDLADGSRLVEIVEDFKGLSSQQLRELNVGVLADEILVDLNSASVRWDDPFLPAISFRVDEALLSQVADGTREVALAVVEFSCEVGDRVAAVDRGEDVEFDTTEHCITQYETYI
jgi:hypothetical protein